MANTPNKSKKTERKFTHIDYIDTLNIPIEKRNMFKRQYNYLSKEVKTLTEWSKIIK